jgi:hypothetical protein
VLPSAADLKVPRAQHERADGIFAITDAFCLTSLDAEYAELCRRLTAKLARKRPTPLAHGRIRSWAAGVVYAVGRMNFLFDRSQSPHLRTDDLAVGLGVAKSTMSAKATEIERLLDLGAFEPELCRAEILHEHPAAWLIAVDGFILDARSLPVELQREAHRRGLIPAVPAQAGRREAA